MNLKIISGGMMMYKRRSVRRKNATNVYTITRVMKTYKKHKETRRNTKKNCERSKGQAYAELYRKINVKEGENDIYKMTKVKKRKTRNFNQVKYIKDETDRLLMKYYEIKNR
jgi:hypothetical protein